MIFLHNYHLLKNKNPRGFTIFFAVLVASLAISVGAVIYDLLVRELTLSQVATQSQFAIYAADTGAECALYWDLNYTTLVSTDADNSAFATSSDAASNGGNGIAKLTSGVSGVNCNTQDIVAPSAITSFLNTPANSNGGWSVIEPNNLNATTTFYISMGTTVADPCAKVEVGKSGNPSQTTVISHGYNTCSLTSGLRLERTLQVNY